MADTAFAPEVPLPAATTTAATVAASDSADNVEGLSPEVRIEEKVDKTHRLDSLILLLFTGLLTLTVVTIWLFKHRRIRYLHETGLALIYGLVIGAVIHYGVDDFGGSMDYLRVKPYLVDLMNVSRKGIPDFLLLVNKAVKSEAARETFMNKTLAYSFKGEVRDIDSMIDEKITFDPELFFNVLLPPIIFHAGYSMKKRFFFRNIGSILVFAFVGTTLSTFTVAGIMYGVTRLFPHLASIFSFADTVRFGALISATDPVTILAIFNDLNVDVNLYALVFGESVLNDAVAIVITRTLEDYEAGVKVGGSLMGGAQPSYVILFQSFGEFVGIFSASFFVGSLIGCFTAIITKFTHIKQHPQLESTLFVLMSYASFLLAEVLHLTGIVAVLFCGICQAHYTYNNMSQESRAITKQFFALLNLMAENFIFSYIGVSIFTFPKHNFDLAFIFGAFLAIIVGRAVNIYPLSFLLNLGRKTKISFALQHMLFLSGLRGAIAFALSIENTLLTSRQMILSTTLLIVVVTVIVCGGSTMSLLTWLGIPIGIGDDETAPTLENAAGGASAAANATSNPSSPRHYNAVGNDCDGPQAGGAVPAGKSALARVWSGFDVNFMKPLLTHSNPTLMETLPGCCLPLARILTSSEQLSRHPAMQNILTDDDSRIQVTNAAAAAEVIPVPSPAAEAVPVAGSSSSSGSSGEGFATGGVRHRLESGPTTDDDGFAEIAGRSSHM